MVTAGAEDREEFRESRIFLIITPKGQCFEKGERSIDKLGKSNTCSTSLLASQQLSEQEGGILVAGHTGGDAVGIGDVSAEGNLETIVVETVGTLVGHAREFKVVGGDNSGDGTLGDKLEEEA